MPKYALFPRKIKLFFFIIIKFDRYAKLAKNVEECCKYE